MVNKWRALNERKKDRRTVSRRRRKKNKTQVASTDADSIYDIADKNIPLPSTTTTTTTTTTLPSVIPSTSLSPVSTSIDSHDQEVSTIATEETASARKIKAAAAHIKSGTFVKLVAKTSCKNLQLQKRRVILLNCKWP